MTDLNHIRNFCIIAHIDHGKSTLADRLMEKTATVDKREMKSQLLDSMELEQERGITIKLTPVTMKYQYQNAEYMLNLIDTPGHVDFSYEVSRSLAACEGAILIVDASQGVQAQTLANIYLALEADLKIIPVLNKIDLPAADVPKASREIVELLGCDESEILKVSAKTGEGVEAVLQAVVERIPAPRGEVDGPTRALIFDSYYDDYRGVVLYVRVVDGKLDKNSNITMLATKADGLALEVGQLKPKMTAQSSLSSGEIGYIVTNLKSTREARVGDTIALTKQVSQTRPLSGYKTVKPFVYAGFFPVSNEDYQDLKDAIEKISLSDSALVFEPENSPVLGFGVRVGFLGLLHMDIIKERLEREYGLELVLTNPSTDYQVILKNGQEMTVKSAADLPDMVQIEALREPWIKGEIIVPKDYVGVVIQLIISKRGQQNNVSYLEDRAVIDFRAPLANLLTDFYDQLKSMTSGYGSFSYEFDKYQQDDLVKLDFYVSGEMVDALSLVVHRTESYSVGRDLVKKLKEVIPRQNFQVSLQAAIGGKFIAREDISAYRKDVTGYLYGGDVSRKKKLLAKQAKGKKRMKKFGKVDIPSEAFMVMLKRD
jgi:GTP-binding protein lepA